MNTSKQLVRTFIQDRATNPQPVPSQDEIRRQLGFGLIQVQETTFAQYEHAKRMFTLQIEREAILATKVAIL